MKYVEVNIISAKDKQIDFVITNYRQPSFLITVLNNLYMWSSPGVGKLLPAGHTQNIVSTYLVY